MMLFSPNMFISKIAGFVYKWINIKTSTTPKVQKQFDHCIMLFMFLADFDMTFNAYRFVCRSMLIVLSYEWIHSLAVVFPPILPCLNDVLRTPTHAYRN